MEITAEAIDDVIVTGRSLYKFDSKGGLRVWYMEQQGDKHRTVAGLDGGALTASEWTTCVGKQKRSDVEQATFEVNSGYTYQLKREYFETPEAAKGDARFFKPMLAEKYKDCKFDGAVARLTKAGYKPKFEGDTGIRYQHKFDGFCCIAQASGLTSREGQPIVSVPHIMEALQPYFDKYPDGVLHGELYHHDLKDNFQQLQSILKKQKNITEEQYAFARKMAQYHMYDYPAPHARDLDFDGRFELLQADLADNPSLGDMLHIAETVPVRDADHIDELMSNSLELGYEGGIGRSNLGEYVQKRSWQVMKIKEFDDGEFTVVDILPGKGNYAAYAKKAVLRNDLTDDLFEAGIKGGYSQFNKDLLGNPASQTVATVRYFGRYNTGIPRMGVVIVWHGDKRTL